MTQAALIFDRLCQERGGKASLSIVDLAVIRQLATILASDTVDAKAASTAAQLLEQLPPRPKQPKYDLALLDDVELEQLQRLLVKASGSGPDLEHRHPAHRPCLSAPTQRDQKSSKTQNAREVEP